MTARRVGVIGLGRMGAAMSRRLLDAGNELWVHNRTASRSDALVERGAHRADSAAAVGRHVDLAISVVADDAALEHVVLAGDGVLSGAHGGLTYVDMSTVSPSASARVAAACARRGVPYLRAPVTGSTVLAERGALGILASGPRPSFETWRETFGTLASKVFYLGPADEARTMKLLLNMMVGITMASFGEALVLGERCGLDWAQMLDVFGESAVGSPLVRYKSAQLRDRDFSPAFTTSMMVKDLDLALDMVRRAGVAAPVTALGRDLLQATAGTGWAERDFASILLLFERWAGVSDHDRR